MREFLKMRGMGLDEFRKLRKGHPDKIALEAELRLRTTMTMVWIAEELNAEGLKLSGGRSGKTGIRGTAPFCLPRFLANRKPPKQNMKLIALLLVTLIFGVGTSWTQSEVPTLPEGPLKIESTPFERVLISIELDLPASGGVVIFPIPHTTSSQKVVRCEMEIFSGQTSKPAEQAFDLGPFKKPILVGQLPKRARAKAIVTMELDFFYSQMVPGIPEKKPPPLSKSERANLLASEWHYEHDERWFQFWMRDNDLLQEADETDRDFAFRALNFIRQEFTYNAPDHDYMQKRIRRLRTGELGFFVSEKSGECWALSRIYTCILRSNGIPSRQVSGFMLPAEGEEMSGHHVKAEVYLEGIGWTLAEIAGAVTSPQRNLLEAFCSPGTGMVVVSQGINYRLPGPKGVGNIGTLSNFAVGTSDGKWEVPVGQWRIKQRQPLAEEN